MTTYRAESSPTKQGAIMAILRALKAPDWASPNLDGLADVLRDLSWLPEEPVTVHWHVHPDLDDEARTTLEAVFAQAALETSVSKRPIQLES